MIAESRLGPAQTIHAETEKQKQFKCRGGSSLIHSVHRVVVHVALAGLLHPPLLHFRVDHLHQRGGSFIYAELLL